MTLQDVSYTDDGLKSVDILGVVAEKLPVALNKLDKTVTWGWFEVRWVYLSRKRIEYGWVLLEVLNVKPNLCESMRRVNRRTEEA